MNKMQLYIDAWWGEKNNFYHYDNFDYMERFVELLNIIERIQPYSVCLPAKKIYGGTDADHIEIANCDREFIDMPVIVDRVTGPEECYISRTKLSKVFCDLHKRKGDIYEGINTYCHARVVGSVNCHYAITEEAINAMPYDEIVRFVAKAFKHYFEKEQIKKRKRNG